MSVSGVSSARSWPTQKALPAPVTTTTRTCGAAAVAIAWASPSCMPESIAFSLSGRLRVSGHDALGLGDLDGSLPA